MPSGGQALKALEIIQLLLQDERVDPPAFGNLAIRKTSANGQVDVVKLVELLLRL